MQELKQKGYLTIILAILVTAILVGGAVFIWQDQTKKAEVQKATADLQADIDAMQANQAAEEDSIPDWQEYSNEEYGYSIQYPQEWSIDESRGKNEVLFNIGVPESRESIEVSESSETLLDIQENFVKNFSEAAIRQVIKMTLAGQDAYRIDTTEFGLKYILIKQGNYLYKITTGGRMIDNGMLDTFIFLDT